MGGFQRQLFGDEMPGRQGLAADHAGTLRLPQRQRLEEPMDHAAFTPQDMGVAGNFFALRAAFAVVHQVMPALAR